MLLGYTVVSELRTQPLGRLNARASIRGTASSDSSAGTSLSKMFRSPGTGPTINRGHMHSTNDPVRTSPSEPCRRTHSLRLVRTLLLSHIVTILATNRTILNQECPPAQKCKSMFPKSGTPTVTHWTRMTQNDTSPIVHK